MTAKASRRMNKLTTKVQIGTAACAMVAAAALTPLPAAHAASTPGSVGGSAGGGASLLAPCDPTTSAACATVAPGASAFAVPSVTSIFQNPLWWFGTPNPNPPTQTPVFTFLPLNLLPSFIRPFFGWFANINFEACIGGLTLRVGPYGALSGGYSRGCA
jgi:hypothetical protein